MTTTDTGTALWPITISPSDHPATAADRDAILADPGFGRSFTDHMVRATWTADDGWHDARLEAYGPLVLDPATNFLHYGQAIFEGLKAYRHADGSIRTFRPIQNAERFAQLRPPAGDGRAARRSSSSARSRRWCARTATGCPAARRSRSTCVRS